MGGEGSTNFRKGTSLSRSMSRSTGSSQQKALSWSEAIRQTARLEDWERDMMLGGWTWTPQNSWERRKKTENENPVKEIDLEDVTKESKTFKHYSSKADSNES